MLQNKCPCNKTKTYKDKTITNSSLILALRIAGIKLKYLKSTIYYSFVFVESQIFWYLKLFTYVDKEKITSVDSILNKLNFGKAA